MLHIAMATHSLKGTLKNRVHRISEDVIVTSFLNQSQQNFVFLFVIPRGISVQNLSKIGKKQRSCKNGKWRHCDVISKNSSSQFLVCEYFLFIPIDVPSFKLIEGQIKELQGVVPNTPPG